MIAGPADFLLATASGVLLAFSFPSFGHPAFAWIALAPLLVALNRPSLARAFALGLSAGLVYFAGTLYWITGVMVIYGGLNSAVAVLVNGALVAYLALFPAMFALVMRCLGRSFGRRALMSAPLVWVATELGRTHLFGGFPWVLLGYSQASALPIAQVSSILGVYGLSALAAAGGATVAAVMLDWLPSGGLGGGASKHAQWPYAWAAGVCVVIGAAALWGRARMSDGELTRAGDPVRVGLIQGNVDQAEKGNETRAEAIFASYMDMSRQAIGQGAQLVIWPESSTPFLFEEEPGAAEQVRALARDSQVPILLGSDQIERGSPTRYYNSAFLVRSDGTTAGVYRKMHLVPFGEYVPLKRVLFFAAPLVEAVSDFSPGDTAELLPVGGHRLSTAICYEIVYPDLIRQFVGRGSELLTTITNDAWFGRTSAPYQHFAQASMRAIEEGRYLVRSANTGISGIVDPYGQVITQSPIFERAVIVGVARFLRTSTVYARHGDVFAYLSAATTLALLIAAALTRAPAVSARRPVDTSRRTVESRRR